MCGGIQRAGFARVACADRVLRVTSHACLTLDRGWMSPSLASPDRRGGLMTATVVWTVDGESPGCLQGWRDQMDPCGTCMQPPRRGVA